MEGLERLALVACLGVDVGLRLVEELVHAYVARFLGGQPQARNEGHREGEDADTGPSPHLLTFSRYALEYRESGWTAKDGLAMVIWVFSLWNLPPIVFPRRVSTISTPTGA